VPWGTCRAVATLRGCGRLQVNLGLTFGALPCSVDDLEPANGVVRVDRRRRALANRSLNTRVEVGPPTGDARNRFAFVTAHQQAPAIRRILAESGVAGPATAPQLILLPVQGFDEERAPIAEDSKARARRGGERASPEMGEDA
jgi:hypothetical protein